MILLLLNLASIICALGAVALAYNGIDGWGWFLVVALFSSTSPTKYREEKG